MIAYQIDNTIIFFHSETGRYHIKTYIQHYELNADVVFDNKDNFDLILWYERSDGKVFNVLGEIEKQFC